MNQDSNAYTNLPKDRTEELLHPAVLLSLDFKSLLTIATLNKRFHRLLEDENSALGFWPAVCNSFCSYVGLYSPVIQDPENIFTKFNYRKHFIDELWSYRYKWAKKESEILSYKVRVSCRFRPGDPPTGRVCLPLHQFLRLRRQKKLENAENEKIKNEESTHKGIFVGEKDPEEFCDPFLGSLMREPVLLTSSGQIVDRTVAVQCIHRGGRDPFNGQRLSMQMLVPQPELAARIQAWRERPERTDVSLDIKDVKGLVDNKEVNQDFLEALLEVERMQALMKKTNKLEHAGGQQSAMIFEVAEENNNVADPDPETINEINPDITVGLINEDEFDEATISGPFSVHRLAQIGAEVNPILGLNNSASQQEVTKKDISRVVEVSEKSSYVSMHVPGTGVRPFHFSNVLPPKISQELMYEKTCRDSVEAALNGNNACVLCYGQTGSGKTFTFLGPEGTIEKEEVLQNSRMNDSNKDDANLILPSSGMVLRSASELFRAREALLRVCMEGKRIAVGIKVQFIEIYEDRVTDLMSGRIVTVRRDTGHVVNGSEHICESLPEFLQLYKIAHGRQKFAETAMNERSSRAHTMVIFHITQQRSVGITSRDENNVDSGTEELLITSQLYLVDLAGSERVKKSKATGQRMREAVGINSSLLVLGKVISSLVEGESHVPYFESKLTTLLKAAFGGNSKTMVMINARSEEDYGDETLQSLRFGERCGMISNTLKNAASYYESTMKILDDALASVSEQLNSLKQRGKQHLDMYRSLELGIESLLVKKQELTSLNSLKM